VDGTIIIKSSTKTATTVEAKDAKITYKDGTFASWNGILTYNFEKGIGRHWRGKTIKITGALTGSGAGQVLLQNGTLHSSIEDAGEILICGTSLSAASTEFEVQIEGEDR